MEYLAWFEATSFSTWMRESGPAFFFSLILHSLAMGFAVGVHVAADLRILGIAPRVPLSLMRRFSSVLWVSLFVILVSGVLLLAAYPAKALTNPVFYLKLAAVAASTADYPVAGPHAPAGRESRHRTCAGEGEGARSVIALSVGCRDHGGTLPGIYPRGHAGVARVLNLGHLTSWKRSTRYSHSHSGRESTPSCIRRGVGRSSSLCISSV